MAISSSREADTSPELFIIIFSASYCSFHISARYNAHCPEYRLISFLFCALFFVFHMPPLPQCILGSFPNTPRSALRTPCIRFSLCLPPNFDLSFDGYWPLLLKEMIYKSYCYGAPHYHPIRCVFNTNFIVCKRDSKNPKE